MKNIDFGFVADIYDDYVHVAFDIPFYQTICKRYTGNILELMCGTGRVSLPLIRDGIQLTAVDYSQEMLDVFSKKLSGTKPSLFCQDVCELEIDNKFVFAFIPFHSFAEITNSEKRKLAVKKITEHLTEDGDLLITLYNPAYRIQSADGNLKCLGKFSISNDRTLVVTYYNAFDDASNLVYGTQFYEIYDSGNKLLDKRYLHIAFSLISKEEIDRLCEEFDLSIKGLYGDYNFGEFSDNSQFMNFLLTKKHHR